MSRLVPDVSLLSGAEGAAEGWAIRRHKRMVMGTYDLDALRAGGVYALTSTRAWQLLGQVDGIRWRP